jgi:adhesin transport system membrane fusion protein
MFKSIQNRLFSANRAVGVRISSSLLLYSIASIFIALVTWSAFAEIDTVTRATGKVIPSGRLQVIQSLEGGIFESISVRAGQPVKKGDVVATLSTVQLGADLNTRSQQLFNAKAKAARFKALAADKTPAFGVELERAAPDLIASERAAFETSRAQFEAQQDVIRAQMTQRELERREARVSRDSALNTLEMMANERKLIAELVQKGLEPRLELIRLDRAISDARGRYDAANVAISRIESSISEMKSRLNASVRQFRSEAQNEYNQAMAEVNAMTQSMPALQDRVNRSELRSPVDGVVNRVLFSTVGAVLKPGELVAEVVPSDDDLLVEAMVDPRDIAFVAVGQPAKVKVTAYDYAIYGSLEGEVLEISPDVFVLNDKGQSAYQVKIKTQKPEPGSRAEKISIMPGMQAQIDIVNGSKTVMQYLSKPLVSVKENAFKER